VSENRPKPVYWGCTVPGGTVVRCDDLPLEVYADIAEQTGVHWHTLLNAPLRQEKAGHMLYLAACKHAGVEPVKLSIAQFADLFELVEEDLPTTFTDGIPDPKADGPVTTG